MLQPQVASCPRASTRTPVEGQVCTMKQRVRALPVSTPGQCFDPREQFYECIRLGEIVVTAGPDALHALVQSACR